MNKYFPQSFCIKLSYSNRIFLEEFKRYQVENGFQDLLDSLGLVLKQISIVHHYK